jgi:hypothetical protein
MLMIYRQHYLTWSPGVMDAFEDARKQRDYVIALESLAIVYSLPLCAVLYHFYVYTDALPDSAALMWAMLTFLTAFGAMVLDHTEPAARGTFAGVLALALGVIVWCGIRLRGGPREVAADVIGAVPRAAAATGRAGSRAWAAAGGPAAEKGLRSWWAGDHGDAGSPSRVSSGVQSSGREPTLPITTSRRSATPMPVDYAARRS